MLARFIMLGVEFKMLETVRIELGLCRYGMLGYKRVGVELMMN